MIALLSLVSGFVSPWIGDLFKLFQAKQDNAHELAMLRESNNMQRDVAFTNAQVGLANAQVQDTVSARQAQPKYGTKLLDALHSDDGWLARLLKPLLVLALTFVEIANGFMRPYAVYIIITLWASVKLATFWLGYASAGQDFALDMVTGKAIAEALVKVWDDHDWIVLDYVLGFLFGSRHKLKESGAK